MPSIVTVKHLDFFKSEPVSKFKPAIFDDGMLQKMDSSFLKAFLNPSEPVLRAVCVFVSYILCSGYVDENEQTY